MLENNSLCYKNKALYNDALLCKRRSLLHKLANLLYKIETRENREASRKLIMILGSKDLRFSPGFHEVENTRGALGSPFRTKSRGTCNQPYNLTCDHLVCVTCAKNFLNVKFRFGNGSKTLVHDYKRCGIATVVGSA